VKLLSNDEREAIEGMISMREDQLHVIGILQTMGLDINMEQVASIVQQLDLCIFRLFLDGLLCEYKKESEAKVPIKNENTMEWLDSLGTTYTEADAVGWETKAEELCNAVGRWKEQVHSEVTKALDAIYQGSTDAGIAEAC